jgi:FixJ family two-component response regulator
MPCRAKILLVDDDPAVRASLTFLLGLEGFAIEAFSCAEELVARIDLPDTGCLLIDYRLPDMDGLTLLKTLRVRGVALPAILTAFAPARRLKVRASEAGAVIVEKPLLCDALTAAVRAALPRQAEAA